MRVVDKGDNEKTIIILTDEELVRLIRNKPVSNREGRIIVCSVPYLDKLMEQSLK